MEKSMERIIDCVRGLFVVSGIGNHRNIWIFSRTHAQVVPTHFNHWRMRLVFVWLRDRASNADAGRYRRRV